MGNADKAKRKAEKKRQRMLKAYYKAYAIGGSTFDGHHVKYIILGKYKLDNEYYFVVQDIHGALHLQKLVYGQSVRIVNVSREGRQYDKNSDVFDIWFAELDKKRTVLLERYYDKTHIGETCNDKNYKLVLKKKYAGKYYFILKDSSNKCVVAQLDWWYTNIYIRVLSDKELSKDRNLFTDCINVAKCIELLRSMER